MVALLAVNPVAERKPESIYRLIIVAGLRSKQLLRGSTPRIEANVFKRKNTSIALEEVRLGLVKYTIGTGANGATPVEARPPADYSRDSVLVRG